MGDVHIIGYEDVNFVQDAITALITCACFTVLRLILNLTILGRHGPPQQKHLIQVSDSVMEECWLACISSVMVAWSCIVLNQTGTKCSVLDTHSCIRDWPNVPLTREVEFFMSVESGWYLHQLLRSHFRVGIGMDRDLFAHHIVTLGMVVTAYWKNLFLLAVLTLTVFNVSSPFMHFSKIAYNLDMRRLRVVLFVLFGFVFFVTRVVMVPMTLIKCCLFDAWEEAVDQFGYEMFFIGNCFIVLLYCLQLMWMYRIVRVITRGKTGTTPKAKNAKVTPFNAQNVSNGHHENGISANGNGKEEDKDA